MEKIIRTILIIGILVVNIGLTSAEEGAVIPKDIQKKLGIKTDVVREKTINITKKYPAVVKDDLTMSQAIYSPVEGIVKRLYVKEGDSVRRGQKLVAIYSPEIAQIITSIKKAKVEVKIKKSIYEREKKLYKEKLIPYTRYFMAKQDYQNSLAKLQALKENLKIYGETSGGMIILRAGINGYIAKQNVILGDSVDINRLIFSIHSHEKLWVVAYLPVDDIRYVKRGDFAKVISPLGTTTGKVDFIGHKVDPKTKRVAVRVIANNRREVLKPNMYVSVEIPFEKKSGLFIPVSAVVENNNKRYVFLKEGKKFRPVIVSIGDRYKNLYEVISGLDEGDRIVVKGTIYLKAKFFGEAEE